MLHWSRIFVVFSFLFFSQWVSAHECTDIQKTDWLLGDWQTQSGTSIINESWQTIDDKNRIGSGTTRKANESTPPFVESLRIIEMSDSVFYLAKTPQNKLPVAFKLVECGDKKLKFENLQHDFPSFIEYQFKNNNQIDALVSSKDSKGFKLSFKRLKPANEVAIVRQYVAAYNRKALDEMMRYADDAIQWMSVKDRSIVVETRDKKALRGAMKNYFQSGSTSYSQIFGVSKNGQYVSGIEKASWKSGGKTLHQCAPVVYQVEQSLIKNVWYFPAETCDNPYP